MKNLQNRQKVNFFPLAHGCTKIYFSEEGLIFSFFGVMLQIILLRMVLISYTFHNTQVTNHKSPYTSQPKFKSLYFVPIN